MILLQTFALGQGLPRPAVPDLQISLTDRLNVFNKTWETVNKHFFDPKFNSVDWEQMKVKYQPLAEAATDKSQLRDVLGRMVRELRASHMGVNGFSRGVNYNYGLDLTQIEGKWLVRGTGEDSVAQHAGVERGWILTTAEGDCVSPERKVRVRMLDLQEQMRSLELPCGSHPFSPESSIVRPLEGGAVYLRFTKFQPAEAKWLADQVARNMSSPAIVLDLRYNPGGAEDTAKQVCNLFFGEKTIIGIFRDRKGKENTLKAGSNSAYRGRLIVLIDHRTRSAAEVFAKAVQETGRGIVAGQTSAGEVLGAMNYNLPSGFGLHLAILDYHSAKGMRLEGRGVQPNVPVSSTARDFRENKDPVLDRVLQLLQRP
jgi:carboxyl-terminal processing protease